MISTFERVFWKDSYEEINILWKTLHTEKETSYELLERMFQGEEMANTMSWGKFHIQEQKEDQSNFSMGSMELGDILRH